MGRRRRSDRSAASQGPGVKAATLASIGGGFMLSDALPEGILTPERFTEEQIMIGRTAENYVRDRVRAASDTLEAGDHRPSFELIREAGNLGLLGADIAESYGGLNLGPATSALIAERVGAGGSFGITFNVHIGIGTLPITLFGTERQKRKYLPGLASGDKIPAFALTEPDAGSDALAGKTTAEPTADGSGFVLNGRKQWITNAGLADVFVVFAKVGGAMAALLVDRDSDGVGIGPEADKMGLRGSSTCDVFFDKVHVPAENLLWEPGRGHTIAFNTLNLGRWKLATVNLGACKAVIEASAVYAGRREQFGRAIGEFPAVQQMLARMAVRTFALESVVYRTAGLLEERLAPLRDGSQTEDFASVADALGEYAVEAAANKVLGSETLASVADDGVQVHGGLGFIRGSEVERAYRDARISRIFEGTNEINRLFVAGTLLRRSNSGRLPLAEAVEGAGSEPSPPNNASNGRGVGYARARDLKRASLLVAGAAIERHGDRLGSEQEASEAVAEMVILAYALESVLLRAAQAADDAGEESAARAQALAALFTDWAFQKADHTARRAMAGLRQGAELDSELARLDWLIRHTPANQVELGRSVARDILSRGAYPSLTT